MHAVPWSPSAEHVISPLAGAVGQLANALGCPEHADAARAIVSSVTADPIRRYLNHVHWPSRLTASGFPFEVSIACARGTVPVLRTLLDLSDHRRTLSANRAMLIAHAERLVHQPGAELARLFASMLEGADENSRTSVNHGSGFSADGRVRSSLYFFIGGSRARPFAERFPDTAAAIEQSLAGAGGSVPKRLHNVSYDFDLSGAVTRRKVYGWVVGRDGGAIQDALGGHPDLREACAFVDVVESLGHVRIDDGALLLQSSQRTGSTQCRHKTYINLQGWEVDHREALLASLMFGGSRLGLELWAVEALLDTFASHGVRLRPSWIAVGPADAMTWYFVPDVHVPSLSASMLTAARQQAIEWLMEVRRSDGSWSAVAGGPADARTTARVAAVLAEARSLGGALEPTAAWLRHQMSRPGHDPSVTLWGCRALHALGIRPEPRAISPADLSAEELALAAALAMDGVLDMSVDDLIGRLLSLERSDGGWATRGDILEETAGVVTLLLPRARQAPLTDALRRAAFRFSDDPVVAEPLPAALWLRGRLVAGLDPEVPSVARALACVTSAQGASGAWHRGAVAAPPDPAAGPDSVVTTATVVDVLTSICAEPALAPSA